MPKVSEDHLAARRSQILDRARQCFAQYGYDGATVRRLEETTGLSRGAIFHHFKDKDGLFLALAHEDAKRMADVVAEGGLVQVMRDMLASPSSSTGSERDSKSPDGCAPTPSSPATGRSAVPNSPRPPSAASSARSRPDACATTCLPTFCSTTSTWSSTA